MLLRLSALLLTLFLTDAEPAGDDGGEQPSGNEPTDAGRAPAQTSTEDRASSRPDSANKLIKDFVKAEGITVEDLIREYGDLKKGRQTEFQRLEGERDTFKTKAEELEARYRTAVASSAVREAAGQAGAISPKAVYALIRDDVQFDDAGEPSNIAELIERAKEDEPQLFRAAGGSGDGGKGNGQGAPRDINAVFRDIARNAS